MLMRVCDWGLAGSMTDDVALLPLLIVQAGPMQGATFRLRGDTCVIGRDEGVDILVEDSRVSRRHAIIERSGGGLTLADAGSTNGTWLNDRRLTDAAELSDGDRIRLGSVELRFYDPTSATTEPVGAAIHAISSRAPRPERPPEAGRAAAALFGPTQMMSTRRSGGAWVTPAAVVLVLIVVLVAWLVLAR
jgi:Inner membrane component of T3SS, cytoplasmic domain